MNCPVRSGRDGSLRVIFFNAVYFYNIEVEFNTTATMKKLLFTLLVLSSSFFTLSAQSWLWARQGKNHTTKNQGAAITMDKFHNAYLTGYFQNDTLILGTDTLLIKGPSTQAFLVKYDENGNLLWAQSSESKVQSGNGSSPTGTESYGIASDLSNNIYITGNFYDTVYFQSSVVENLYNPLVFVTKYDANGNVKWAKQCSRVVGRGSVCAGEALVTDNIGNIYVTGYFYDTVSFDSQVLKSQYEGETFLVKYDSNGNVLWAKQSVGINRSDAGGNAIATDKYGYIYVTGNFSDTMSFGAQILRTSYNGDVFIVKYDSNGNVIWAKEANTLNQNEASSVGICTDKNGNIYLAGYFADTVSFGATTLVSGTKDYSIFWAKYDSSGNVLWAKQSHDLDSMDWYGSAINIDAGENLYLTGCKGGVPNFYGNAKIVFDADTLQMNDVASPFFFIKMDTLGKVSNDYLFETLPGGSDEIPLAIDSSGCYVYLGGDADTTIVFGKDTIGTTVNPKPNTIQYPFIARWSDGKCTDEGVSNIENKNFTVNLYPNPNKGIFMITISQPEIVSSSQTIVEIYNVLGEKIHSQFTSHNSQLTINLGIQPTGIYLYRIISQQINLISSGKFIIQ
jgi:hypothetical protein